MRASILKLAWPVLIGQLAIMMNGLIDTVMAGRLSAVDLAGIGIASSIYVSAYIGLMGVLIALTPVAAQHFGAQRFSEIGADTRQALWLALALSIVGTWVIAQTDWWIALAQPPQEIEPVVRGYLYAVAAGLPGALAFRVFYAMNNAIARPKAVMSINLIGLALKIPLNLLFMYGAGPIPAMGGAGCGVATAVISWCAALIALLVVLRDPSYERFELLGSLRPEWRRIIELLRLGIPIAIGYVIEVTSFTAMSIALARSGTVVSASQQIAGNLISLAYMFALSMAIATSTLTGHALGAGDVRLARRTALYGIRLTVLVGLVIGLVIVFGRHQIAALYTSDPLVAAAAVGLLVWAGIYHVFDATQCTLSFTLRAYKVATMPTVVYAIALWGIGLGLGWWLAFVANVPGLAPAQAFWMAGTLGVLITAVGLGWVQWRTFWRAQKSAERVAPQAVPI
jgi:multidrug resistance protein, MATE family